MGKNSGGGSTGGGGGVSAEQRERYSKISAIKNIKDRDTREAMIEALAQFENETGMQFTNIGTKTMSDAAHYDALKDKVFINSKYSQDSKYWTKATQKLSEKGEIIKMKSGNEAKYMITHELAHAQLSRNHQITKKGPDRAKYAQAYGEVQKVYKSFMSDTSSVAKSYGKYARTNASEFFAEATAKGILGSKDKYTRQLKAITKKYGL